MDNRTYTRLAYAFSSIATSPHLTLQFIRACKRNGGIPELDALQIILEYKNGSITKEDLLQAARIMILTQDADVSLAGHMLNNSIQNRER
jgi:hypothetical protein